MHVAWADWRRRSRPWLIATGAVIGLALLFGRDWISERLVPDPRMNRQLERAQAALARGNLTDASGAGARQLFESVLATDPDQMTARQGLVDVRDEAIRRTEIALSRHQLAQARSFLELARALSAQTVQLQPLQARLHDLEAASGNIGALLAQAKSPATNTESALQLYSRVLELDADNLPAERGRRELLSQQLALADSLIDRQQLATAQVIIDRVVAIDPAHLDLPPAKARLGEAQLEQQREQERVLASAQAEEKHGRIESAAEKYLKLRDQGYASTEVSAALQRLAGQLAQRAQRQAADFQFARAEASLARARRWSPELDQIVIVQQRLRQSKAARRKLALPVAADREKLPVLLAEAEQAMQRGEFITPPGTSAWDKLRVASAIAGNAPAVLALQREFARLSLQCFEQSMTDNQLTRAHTCLEANLAQGRVSPAAIAARQRLADRWLADAEERIGASDYAGAEKSLAYTRRWQPGHPMLKRTQARLARARGAAR